MEQKRSHKNGRSEFKHLKEEEEWIAWEDPGSRRGPSHKRFHLRHNDTDIMLNSGCRRRRGTSTFTAAEPWLPGQPVSLEAAAAATRLFVFQMPLWERPPVWAHSACYNFPFSGRLRVPQRHVKSHVMWISMLSCSDGNDFFPVLFVVLFLQVCVYVEFFSFSRPSFVRHRKISTAARKTICVFTHTKQFLDRCKDPVVNGRAGRGD